jgi:curved DNA-binding protein CbpA
MAAADHGGPGPDHYQLLGVARGASREEIAQAWRRRARAEHPDRQPGEAGDEAAGRFRALAEAYRVLSDPGRRAAYDRALAGGRAAPGMPTAVPVPVRVAGPSGGAGLPPVPGPPLRAGPVRVEGPSGVPASGRDRDEDEIRLAALAALALRRLARNRHWPWPDRDWPW